MIKPNKTQQDSILRSGYRNQLKKHSEHSESNKGSQANRSDFEDGIKSTVSKQTRRLNQKDKSQSSQRSRNTSVQRALNTAFGSHLTHHHPPAPTSNHVNFQVQSHVRQTYPITIPSQYHYKKPIIHRHPSQPIAPLNHSRSNSDVNTQIQTLNRLRQEHEIIKQVTSDDELREYEQNEASKSNLKNSEGDFSRRRYVYESRESVPVQIIRNKTLGRMTSNEIRSSNKNRNPEREEEQQDKYSVESDKQDKPKDLIKQQLKVNQQPTLTHRQPTTAITNRQYLIQISTLQSALTQSSLKIQQLLTESLKNKQKLLQYSQMTQKTHRLQNQLKMHKQTQKYLKRQIQMKDQQIGRFQKRVRIMKQTMEMMEKEVEMKDKEMEVMRGVILGRGKESIYGVSYEKELEKIRELVREKQDIMRSEIEIQLVRNKYEKQRSTKPQTYDVNHPSSLTQSLEDIKQKLQFTQHQLYQLQSTNLKLTRQLDAQKQRTTQYLQQTISSRVKYQLAQSGVTNSNNHKLENQSLISREIESIRGELSKLQESKRENLNELGYISELQNKLRGLQEVIKSENEQKRRFIKEIQRIREQQLINSQKITTYTREINQLNQQNQSLKRQNQLARTQLSALKSYNQSLTKLQSQITVNCIPKQQYTQLQRQNTKLTHQLKQLKSQLDSLKSTLNEKTSNQKVLTPQQRQQLINNLDQIKQEYLQLQQAYFDKAKQSQQLKIQLFSRQSSDVQQLEHELNQLHLELQSERQYSKELQQKVHQKEFKLIEFLNIAENNSTYNQKISQLHKVVSQLEIKLKQRDFAINQLNMQHKKQLNASKQSLNQLHLQLSQKTLQLISLQNSLQQQRKLHCHQTDNYLKQLQIHKKQLQEQQKHHQTITKMDRQLSIEQTKLLEAQIFTLVKQKQKLLQQTLKMSHLQYQVRMLLMRDKQNRRMNQSVEHLWMVKEAEYYNLNQILNMVKVDSRGIDNSEGHVIMGRQQQQLIRISQ